MVNSNSTLHIHYEQSGDHWKLKCLHLNMQGSPMAAKNCYYCAFSIPLHLKFKLIPLHCNCNYWPAAGGGGAKSSEIKTKMINSSSAAAELRSAALCTAAASITAQITDVLFLSPPPDNALHWHCSEGRSYFSLLTLSQMESFFRDVSAPCKRQLQTTGILALKQLCMIQDFKIFNERPHSHNY